MSLFMHVGGERVRTATSSILELVQKEGSKKVCRSVKFCQFFLPFPTSQSQNPQIVHPAIQNSNDKNFITFVPVKDQIPADRKATILRQAIYLTS